MADDISTAIITSSSADSATSSAASSTTTTTTTAVAAEPKKKLWGDEEPDEKPADSTAQTGGEVEKEKPEEELKKIESLSIADSPEDVGPPLDDPDDSEIRAVTSGDAVYTSAMTFEDLKLSDELIKGLYVEMGFSKPSKIQAVTLPMILTPPYKDLVAQAHNGSGKTTCFVLGMLSRVDPKRKSPQAICICPTRELAQQNQAVLNKMGKYTGITSFLAIPMDQSNYIPVTRCPPVTDQVVIGTPGTIKKWTSAKKLGTRDVQILVFDEADHMLAEDGFRDDSLRIMKEIQRSSGSCQVLLFSATFNDTVKEFVSRVVSNGNQIFVKKEDLTLDKVKQYKVKCPDELAKMDVIKSKIFEFGQKVGQTIIFVRTRESATMLHQELKQAGYSCTSIQGAQRQEERDKIIKEFKDGLTTVLITTDLLARGFDQSQVNLVVNFDLPVKYSSPMEPDCEVYLHRIGRAGRFGRKVRRLLFFCASRLGQYKVLHSTCCALIETRLLWRKLSIISIMLYARCLIGGVKKILRLHLRMLACFRFIWSNPKNYGYLHIYETRVTCSKVHLAWYVFSVRGI